MVAPVYNTDLIVINDADSNTDWVGVTSGSVATTTLFTMQGAGAVDRGVGANNTAGSAYNMGAPLVLDTEQHYFVLMFIATPGTHETYANGGVSIFGGTARTSDYVRYYVDGVDTFGGGGRVGKVYPMRPNITPSAVEPYRIVTGSPSVDHTYIGSMCTAGSSNLIRFGTDVIRYGTGLYITEGEVGDPANFDDIATESDLLANRWGLLTPILGQYVLQGKFVIGQDSTKTPTLCYFSDNNKGIVIEENPHVLPEFNEFIIDHASTICLWDFISIKSLGSTSKGNVTVTANNPVFTVNDSTFDKTGKTTLRSNSTMTRVSWIGAEEIETNGGTLESCSISNNVASSAVVCSDLADIQNTLFVSSGTGHAVELDSIGGGSMTWNNQLSNYAGTDGSTGNEAIFVNVGSGTLTINVSDSADTPSIRTAGATVNVVAGLKTFAFTLNPSITGYEWRLYLDSGIDGELGSVELAGQETATQDNQSYSYTPSGDDAVLQIMADGYEESITYYSLGSNDQNITINLTLETNS